MESRDLGGVSASMSVVFRGSICRIGGVLHLLPFQILFGDILPNSEFLLCFRCLTLHQVVLAVPVVILLVIP